MKPNIDYGQQIKNENENEGTMAKKEKPITEMTCPHCGNRTKLARWHTYNNVLGDWMCECPICKGVVEGLPSE